MCIKAFVQGGVIYIVAPESDENLNSDRRERPRVSRRGDTIRDDWRNRRSESYARLNSCAEDRERRLSWRVLLLSRTRARLSRILITFRLRNSRRASVSSLLFYSLVVSKSPWEERTEWKSARGYIYFREIAESRAIYSKFRKYMTVYPLPREVFDGCRFL